METLPSLMIDLIPRLMCLNIDLTTSLYGNIIGLAEIK